MTNGAAADPEAIVGICAWAGYTRKVEGIDPSKPCTGWDKLSEEVRAAWIASGNYVIGNEHQRQMDDCLVCAQSARSYDQIFKSLPKGMEWLEYMHSLWEQGYRHNTKRAGMYIACEAHQPLAALYPTPEPRQQTAEEEARAAEAIAYIESTPQYQEQAKEVEAS